MVGRRQKTVPKKLDLEQKMNYNWSLSFSFRFFSTRSQSPLFCNTDHWLYNTVSLKKPFTNLNSFNIVKNILPRQGQKPYSCYKIFNESVSGWSKKKHLYCTISRRPRTTFSKHLESKCILSLRKFLFQRRKSFYLVGAWIIFQTIWTSRVRLWLNFS